MKNDKYTEREEVIEEEEEEIRKTQKYSSDISVYEDLNGKKHCVCHLHDIHYGFFLRK